MFRNAVASSSKLTLGVAVPRAAARQSSGFATSARVTFARSPSRSDESSTTTTLRETFPNLAALTPTPAATSTSSVRPPRSPTSVPGGSRIPTISSLSPTRAPSPPKYRWDPLPTTDDTPSTHTLTVMSTRNNLLLTLSDRQGPLFPTITGGTGKTFKNAARSGYEAAHQAALKMFEKMKEVSREAPVRGSRGIQIRLAYKGFQGQGAEAFSQALGGNEGGDVRKMIVKVEDRTGVKIGGTRARKPRRL